MNCEHVEELLGPLAGGELDAATEADVRAHVASCARCRESLAAYEAVESALVLRRGEVPAPGRILDAALRAVRPHRSSRARTVMDAVFSPASLAAFAFAFAGLASFVYRGALVRFLSGFSTPSEWAFAGDHITRALLVFTGGDVWMLTAVYAGLTAIVLLGTGLVGLRFLRS